MGKVGQRFRELGIFLRGFVKKPMRVGTGLQSSGFMVKIFDKVLDDLVLDDGCVVELGAGCGRLTEKILEKLGPTTKLLCFELEPLYADYLRHKFSSDARVEVVEDRAENLAEHLNKRGFEQVPTVISAVPIKFRRKDDILGAIHDCLSDGGRMVQMSFLKKKYFTNQKFAYLRRHVCVLNMPPEMLHLCEKRSDLVECVNAQSK